MVFYTTCPCIFLRSRHNFRNIKLQCGRFSNVNPLISHKFKNSGFKNKIGYRGIIRGIFIFQTKFFGDSLGDGCWQQMQTFNTLTAELYAP